MEKIGFASMKSLKQLKSLSGSTQGTTHTFSLSSRSVPDPASLGGFVNLKIAAEKLVKEQASLKSDLEMANTKLRKSVEQVRILEEKLQNAFNENAKLKVKQKEDEKLWKGLESKFSSTKKLSDQLTETLRQLASQVQDAEKDKEDLEAKLSARSITVDGLNQRMIDLSLKVESAEETIRKCEKDLENLRIEKEEICQLYKDEQKKTINLIEEKDSITKKFEESVTENKLMIENLNSKLEDARVELNSKEDKIISLIATQDHLQKEKSDLQMFNSENLKKLSASLLETKNLEKLFKALAAQLVELDRQNLIFLENFNQLNMLHDTTFKLAQLKSDIASEKAQKQYDKLHDKLMCITSEKNELQFKKEELHHKVNELQNVQESLMAKLLEESQLAGERIQKLEAKAQTLVSKKAESELLVLRLEEEIAALSGNLRSSERKMQDLLQKISTMETENQSKMEELQKKIQNKSEEIDVLTNESENHKKHADMLEKEGVQFQNILKEKEQFILHFNEREKKLEEQNKENQSLLNAVESKLSDAKKQYDMMLESKQLELSRHLKEISHRNDQAINDIRKKYEVEKSEIVKIEKEKADMVIQEMERNCEQKLVELKEESRQLLMHTQEEHAALLSQIQQEHTRNKQIIKAEHNEELKRTQLQAESEFKEKLMLLRNEHEAQMKALIRQNEDECRKLQEDLDLQKTKEERQRALLQLQWKVMGDKRQEDQEVNSKDYSVSSIKMRGSCGSKKSKSALVRAGNEEVSPYLQSSQTPVSKLLKTVENINTGSVANIPKHHKRVTHHEYEVETNNGRTITKRRKTRSTVLFEDSRKHNKTPRRNTPRVSVQTVKDGGQSRPSNIGDLFTEGSLNPYADDPYAFD